MNKLWCLKTAWTLIWVLPVLGALLYVPYIRQYSQQLYEEDNLLFLICVKLRDKPINFLKH